MIRRGYLDVSRSQTKSNAMLCNVQAENQTKHHPVRLKPRCKCLRSSLFILFHEFDECLFVHESGVLSILQNTQVPEAEFGETLVNKVDGGVYV